MDEKKELKGEEIEKVSGGSRIFEKCVYRVFNNNRLLLGYGGPGILTPSAKSILKDIEKKNISNEPRKSEPKK